MIRTAILLLALPLPALAVTLEMPNNAILSVQDVTAVGSYAMPTGPWSTDGLPVLIGEGEVVQQAWRIETPGLTTLQVLGPLQKQLDAAGFETVFSCSSRACGGFDFRFATSVLPAPAMHVDLGDYQFFAARRGEGVESELISLLASRSNTAGFVQVTRVGPASDAPVTEAQAPAIQAVSPTVTGGLVQELEATCLLYTSDAADE